MESDNYVYNLKLEFPSTKPICRCCLKSHKPNYYDVFSYGDLLSDLTGITVTKPDGMPRWVCLECIHLLRKAVKFKHRILQAHNALTNYLVRCDPFTMDVSDPELTKKSTATSLVTTPTMVIDTLGRSRNGFHKVLEHSKHQQSPSLVTVELYPVDDTKSDYNVKDEMDFSDLEDNIPLDEYKTGIDKISEDSLAKLLQDSDSLDLRIQEENVKRRKKKKEKRKKESTPERPVISRIRRPIDIDPNKIRIIDLDPIEQVKQRKEESEGYMKLPYKCELCYKGFNFQDKLDNHMKKHSPSRGKYECKLCHMHLPTLHSHGVHMLIHTRRYECLKCGRRMIDRNSIIEHYRGQHEGIVSQFTCHLCGKVSSNNKTHRGHMRNHHGGERPRCDQCAKTFVNKDSLAEHLLIHQGIKNHECPECQKRFRTKTQLKYHQLKHTDVKEFYCVECDTRFKSAHNLRQHLIKSLKHKDVKSFKYQCPQCDKRFETPARRDTHVAIQHQGRRPHTCDVCGAALSTRASLMKHVRGHGGAPVTRSHVCHTCGRAFSGASNLANHARTHTGEKPFACARCGRAFSQRTAMLTHVKLVHLKVKRGTKVKPEILEPEKAIPLPEEMPPAPPAYGEAWLNSEAY